MNTRIGGKFTFKGISGGEKKRLAFASEVLTNPSVLFCDEPTSGLDSFMAQNLIECLKTMASEGRTIICTIHQPSSQVFALFDNILFMADGRVAFMGTTREAKEFFSSLGYKICDNYLDFSHSPIMITNGTENKSEDTFDEQTDGNEDIVDRGHRAGVWRQMFTLFWRSYLILIRNPLLLKVRFMRSLVLALFLGAIYYKQFPISSDVENINAALFLVIQNTMFMNTLFCIQIFCMEAPIFLREYKNRLYGVFPYFVSTAFIQLPVITLTGIIFIAVIYYMVGFNPEPHVFFTCYFISAINKTMMGALAMFTPMVMPMMLFGGLFLNSGNMPGWLSWIQYLSFIHYGYESLVVNQWKDIDY
ncbi:unnamed protein product, partial [Oppiella nova]